MNLLAFSLGIIAICAIVWGLDCHRARRRSARDARNSAACEEDARLDALAAEVDRRLEESIRRRRRPATSLARVRA